MHLLNKRKKNRLHLSKRKFTFEVSELVCVVECERTDDRSRTEQQCCYRVVLRLKFIVTVELLYDQAESDFVQCQTKMRAFASRICGEFKQIELN